MKYLKTYKVFESSSVKVKDYLGDIFLDIKDRGIEVDVDRRYIRGSDYEELTGYKVIIGDKSIHRMNDSAKTFLMRDVYDSIQMAKSYIQGEGFFLSDIRGGSPDKYGGVENYGLLYGFNLYQNRHLDKSIFKPKYKLFDKPLVYLEIDFRK